LRAAKRAGVLRIQTRAERQACVSGLSSQGKGRGRREVLQDASGTSDEPVSANDGRTGQKFQSAYLNEMPAVDFVKREIQGKDSTDTLARQIAVFNKLTSVISSFRLAANRYDLTHDEQKIAGKYSLAAYELEQGYKKTHTAAEADALTHLQAL